MELERQTTRRMDSLQMLSMCAMRSSLAAEASCSVFASPEVCVLYQCSIASPMKYTFWRIMEWRYNKKTSCRKRQDELGSAKDNGCPINRLSLLLHFFNQSLYLLTFDVFGLFHKKKNCVQMVLALASDQRSSESARYLLLCLEAYPAFPAKLQHKVIRLVQVCQLL